MHVKVYSKIEVNFCRIISGDKKNSNIWIKYPPYIQEKQARKIEHKHLGKLPYIFNMLKCIKKNIPILSNTIQN